MRDFDGWPWAGREYGQHFSGVYGWVDWLACRLAIFKEAGASEVS